MASPFTAKMGNVMPCTDIIKQGRSTLVNTVQMFKILGLLCLSTAYSLSVTITSASENNPFALDYMVFLVQETLSSPSTLEKPPAESTSLSNILSLRSTSSMVLSTIGSSPASSPSASRTDLSAQVRGSSPSGEHTIGIASGVVGGIALVTALLVFWWWKRRVHQSDAAPEDQGQ